MPLFTSNILIFTAVSAMTDDDLCIILRELNEDHKELLYLCAIRLFSSTKIAAIRGQSDRNIRKVRGTMLKKIRKKLLTTLTEKVQKQQPLTLLEKEFLIDNGEAVEYFVQRQYDSNTNAYYMGYDT